MEVIFKDDEWYFCIEDNILYLDYISIHPHINEASIKHLDEVDILYHYRNKETDKLYPVYYEHNGRFITKDYTYYTWDSIHIEYTKDYTLVNLKLLGDGNII